MTLLGPFSFITFKFFNNVLRNVCFRLPCGVFISISCYKISAFGHPEYSLHKPFAIPLRISAAFGAPLADEEGFSEIITETKWLA
jgi:hypothetical protein